LRVLYSVGPDRRDDHGAAFTMANGIGSRDISFVIPALDSTAPANKVGKAGRVEIWRLAPTTAKSP
jgi:hypothetical protein